MRDRKEDEDKQTKITNIGPDPTPQASFTKHLERTTEDRSKQDG